MKKSWHEMDLPMGDIKSFSRVVCKLLTVAIFVNLFVMIMLILSEIWPVLGGSVDIVTVGGWRPFMFDIHLLRIGQSAVFIPVTPFGLIIFGPYAMIPASPVAFVALAVLIASIGHGIFMAIFLYLRVIFKELKESESPFSKKMVWRIFIFAVITTVSTVTTNFSLTSVLFVAFMWLMYCIFYYGSKLQEESDTTL